MTLPLGVGRLLSPAQRRSRVARSLLARNPAAEDMAAPLPISAGPGPGTIRQDPGRLLHLAGDTPPGSQDQEGPIAALGQAIMDNPISGYLEDIMRSGEDWLRKHPKVWHALEEAPYRALQFLPFPFRRFTAVPPRWPVTAGPVEPSPLVRPGDAGFPAQQAKKQTPPEGPPKIDQPKPGEEEPPKLNEIPVYAGPEPFARAFSDYVLERNPWGRHGDPLSRLSSKLLKVACEKAAGDRYETFRHIAGTIRPEPYLQGPNAGTTRGGSYPDISLQVTHANGKIIRLLLNTTTMLKNGTDRTANEERRLLNLQANAKAPRNFKDGRENYVGSFGKILSKAKDFKEDYKQKARVYCNHLLDQLEHVMLDQAQDATPMP